MDVERLWPTPAMGLRWVAQGLQMGGLTYVSNPLRQNRLLTGPDPLRYCPACGWPLDADGRCPKCFDRLCVDCGKLTGSYCILRCMVCGIALPRCAPRPQ